MSDHERLVGTSAPVTEATQPATDTHTSGHESPPDLPDYNGMLDDDLKDELRRRGITLRGCRKTSHYVNALKNSDREISLKLPDQTTIPRTEKKEDVTGKTGGNDTLTASEKRTWLRIKEQKRLEERKQIYYNDCKLKLKSLPYYDLEAEYNDSTDLGIPWNSGKRGAIRRVLKERQDLMFESTFKHDSNRPSFLDLPGEIRNIIYEHALFNNARERHWNMSIRGNQYKCRPRFYRRAYRWFPGELTISTLKMLCAMNKQIRGEARSLFWSLLQVTFEGSTDLTQHAALQGFLKSIGTDVMISIKELNIDGSGFDLDPEPTGYTAFYNFLGTLSLCKSLRRVHLDIAVSNIFRGDRKALAAHLMDNKLLESPGLKIFKNTLSSLPRLNEVQLNMRLLSSTDYYGKYKFWKPYREPDQFFHFAFTGLRQEKSWAVIHERLQANSIGSHSAPRKLNGRILVWIEYPGYERNDSGSSIMDYNDWPVWYNALTWE